jgi:hypothetical protein
VGNWAIVLVAMMLGAIGGERFSITITPAETPLEWTLFVFNVIVISGVVLAFGDMRLRQKLPPPHPYSTRSFWITFFGYLALAFALTFWVWSARIIPGTGIEAAGGWFAIVSGITLATKRILPPRYKTIEVGLSFGLGFFLAISFFANIHTRW